jgi:hypothetical protein
MRLRKAANDAAFLDVFLRLQGAHRVLGFPSLHIEGFQQAFRKKLIENGCGRTVSSGCRTAVAVIALHFDPSQAADAGSSAYSNEQVRIP